MTDRRSFLRMLGFAPVVAPLMVAAAKAAPGTPAKTPNEYFKTVVADHKPPIWEMRIDAHGASPEAVERLGRAIAEQKRLLHGQIVQTVKSAKKVGRPLSTAEVEALQFKGLPDRDAIWVTVKASKTVET